MRLFISIVGALCLCACALLAACNPQDGSAPAANTGSRSVANGNATAQTAKQTPAQNIDDTRRISIEEAQAAIAAGNAVIVDVRSEGIYKVSHIKGAKSIPVDQFEQRGSELPKDKLIITYCA
jgi:3-mercaptopyruvate sulfurtransferase SseA